MNEFFETYPPGRGQILSGVGVSGAILVQTVAFAAVSNLTHFFGKQTDEQKDHRFEVVPGGLPVAVE